MKSVVQAERSPAATRAKPRRRKKERARWNMALVGDARRAGRLASALTEEISVDFTQHTEVAKALESADQATLAMFLVEPLAEGPPARALQTWRSRTKLPTYVVTKKGLKDSQARMLYRKGATVVFEWPREALIIPRVVLETLSFDLRPQQRGTEEDRRLAAATRARLRLIVEANESIRVSARRGTVHLAGNVDSLRRKQRLEDHASEVPGVQGLVATELQVLPSRPDRELARNLRAILKRAASVNEEAIALTVENGVVALAGAVPGRSTLERVQELVANVDGVRGINNTIVVSPTQNSKARSVARDLKPRIAKAYPHLDVGISIVDDIVLLVGRVDLLSTKRRIESVAESHGSINRIINKIEVSKPPKARRK